MLWSYPIRDPTWRNPSKSSRSRTAGFQSSEALSKDPWQHSHRFTGPPGKKMEKGKHMPGGRFPLRPTEDDKRTKVIGQMEDSCFIFSAMSFHLCSGAIASWMMLDTMSMAVPKSDRPTFCGAWQLKRFRKLGGRMESWTPEWWAFFPCLHFNQPPKAYPSPQNPETICSYSSWASALLFARN